jgi:AcrR family transcriptional regulator
MARPTVISDDLILDIARKVFLQRGLSATTAEIAERAGVSQGILFKRFKTKNALFQAAMKVDGDPTKPLPIDFDERLGKVDVQKTLIEIGEFLIHKFMGLVPTMMMCWSSRDEIFDDTKGMTPPDKIFEQGPMRGVKAIQTISKYLSKEAKLKRVRQGDFEILAQTLIGACWYYAFLQVMVGEIHQEPMTPTQYVKGVVKTMWSGIAPFP